MSLEKVIKQLESEISVRDRLIVAVRSHFTNMIGHCTCTVDSPCRDCKAREHILELLDGQSQENTNGSIDS